MRRRWVVVCVSVVVALPSCASRSRVSFPTPLPTLESMKDVLAPLTPAPSPSPTSSPTASVASAASTGSSSGGGTSPAQPAKRQAAPSRVVCPSGRVTADVDDVSAEPTDSSPSGEPRSTVSVSGTATNGTSAAVRSVHLVVTVHASNARASSHDVTIGQTIGPGATVGWSTSFRYRSGEEPSSAQVTVAGWSWANSSLSTCPK